MKISSNYKKEERTLKTEGSDKKKTASVIFVIRSGIRQDPTCLWAKKTKKFERFMSQETSEVGNAVTAVIKENKGDNTWTSRFIFITEHDLSRIPSILKRIDGDTDPEYVAIVGRRFFLSKFFRTKDQSRYYWTGDHNPFGWAMCLDRDGEKLDHPILAALADEIATVFMTRFEEELENERLSAARKRTQRPL